MSNCEATQQALVAGRGRYVILRGSLDSGSLELLAGRGLDHATLMNANLDEQTSRVVGSWHALNSLTIDRCKITDPHAFAKAIGQLPFLQSLILVGEETLDRELHAIAEASRFPAYLKVVGPITDDGVTSILRGKPTDLTLERAVLSPRSVRSLGGFGASSIRLHHMVLEGSAFEAWTGPLDVVSFEGSSVSAEDVACLSRSSSVVILILSNTQVDEHVVPALSQLSNLRHLSLEGTRIHRADLLSDRRPVQLDSISIDGPVDDDLQDVWEHYPRLLEIALFLPRGIDTRARPVYQEGTAKRSSEEEQI